MAQKAAPPQRNRVTAETLVQKGLHALDVAPGAPLDAEWRTLLRRLEVLTLGTSSGAKGYVNEAVHGSDVGHTPDTSLDDAPRRLLRETVAYLRSKNASQPSSRDTELAKYNALVSQVNQCCRKSMVSTATTSSSPPTMASDKGSTSSLSVPPADSELPSPSPLKFTFTRTHSNSFAVDVFADESIPQPSMDQPVPSPKFLPPFLQHEPPQPLRRVRSDTVPKVLPLARSRSTSVRETQASNLQRVAIAENAIHDGRAETISPSLLPKVPKPPIPKRSQHRHSRSLPALRAEVKQSQLPTQPPIRENVSFSDHTSRPRAAANEYVNQSHLFFGGGQIPSLPASKPQKRLPTKRNVDTNPEARWTVHNRDSWEVVPPTAPTDPPRPSISQGAPLAVNTASPQSKSKGLGLLKRRLSKSQLTIKTGPLSSLASINSPSLPPLPPINVNMVITGPSTCGVSTLIQRFMTGNDDWVPSSTIDDFWHHVVQSESRSVYYNMTEVTGSEEYVDLRRAVLRRAQVVLLCFRLDSREQFREAIVRLVEDIHAVGMIPIVLVGTFQDSPSRQITTDEAQTAAEALHASYFECSPLLGRGVQELFKHAAKVLQAVEELRPTPAVGSSPPPSATRALFNLVRGRRSYSQSTASPRTRSATQHLPQSASFKRQTFAESSPLVPVLNIAPDSEPASTNLLLLGPQHFKCVIHGGESSGRKSLVHRYLHGTFEWLPEVPWMTWKAAVNVVPKEHERRPSLPPVAGSMVPYALSISETGANKSLDSLRRSTYIGVNVFVICFSVSDYREEVMQEIKGRWHDECRNYGAHIPIIVVATKIDQREGTMRAWTTAQGRALSQSIRAAAYLECSAATGQGIEDVFQTIVRVAAETQVHAR